MKAEITKDGYIKITAETHVEAFAMKGIFPLDGEICEKCGQMKVPLTIDSSILNEQ
jgi:hypothetical protein